MQEPNASGKILIYSHIPLWNVHLADLAAVIMRNSGKEITFLVCDSALSVCPTNPIGNRDRYVCRKCTKTNIKFAEKIRESGINIKVRRLEREDWSNIMENEVSTNQALEEEFERIAHSEAVEFYRDIELSSKEQFLFKKLLIWQAQNLYRSVLKVLNQQPELEAVYVWNARRSSDAPVMMAASETAVPSYSFISPSPERIIITREGTINSSKRIPEEISAFVQTHSDLDVEEMSYRYFKDIRLGKSSRYGSVWFSKEFVDDENLIQTITSSRKPLLLIATSTQWEALSDKERLTPIDFQNQFDVIKRICKDDGLLRKFEIVIRWHPNVKNAGIGERNETDKIIASCDRVKHVSPESNINSYTLVEQADTLVHFGTTLGLEASYQGKSTILLGHSNLSKCSIDFVPASYDEFRQFLLEGRKHVGQQAARNAGAWLGYGGSSVENVELGKRKIYLVGPKKRVIFHQDLVFFSPAILLGSIMRRIKSYLQQGKTTSS